MATPVNTIMVCPFFLTSSIQAGSVNGVTMTALSGGYNKTLGFGVGGTPNGALETPWDLQTALGARTGVFNIQVNTSNNGFYTFKNNATGSQVVVLGQTTQRLIGFASNVVSLSAGETKTADYQPAFALFNTSKPNDSGYRRIPGFMASCETGDGKVYAFRDGFIKVKRSFDLQHHPLDHKTVVSRSSNATQMYPESTTYNTQRTDPHTFSGPYSVWQFMNDAVGLPCTFILGGLVDLLAGRPGFIDIGYIAESTIKDASQPVQYISNNKNVWNWNKVEVTISSSVKVNG